MPRPIRILGLTSSIAKAVVASVTNRVFDFRKSSAAACHHLACKRFEHPSRDAGGTCFRLCTPVLKQTFMPRRSVHYLFLWSRALLQRVIVVFVASAGAG